MPNIFSLLRRGSPIPAESPEVGAHPGSESGQAAENEARRRVSEGEAHSRAAVNEARLAEVSRGANRSTEAACPPPP